MQEFDPQYESDYLDNITGDDDMDNTVQKPNIFSVGDLLDMDLPEIKWLLYPFIPQKGVCMISAPRGVGKSFLAMTMAISIASSIDFLGFKTEQQYKVLYIDGEMNGKMLQERFAKLIDGMEKDGATVVVEYTKSRSVAGDAVAKFAIKLCGTDNILYWTVAKTDEQSELDDLLDFVDNKGMDVSEISKETGMSKSALYRKFQAAGIKDVSARAKLAKQKQAEDTKSLIDI